MLIFGLITLFAMTSHGLSITSSPHLEFTCYARLIGELIIQISQFIVMLAQREWVSGTLITPWHTILQFPRIYLRTSFFIMKHCVFSVHFFMHHKHHQLHSASLFSQSIQTLSTCSILCVIYLHIIIFFILLWMYAFKLNINFEFYRTRKCSC